jgi:hypothetical protein
LDRLTDGAVASGAIELIANRVLQMTLRQRALKHAELLQKSLENPATDLGSSLEATQLEIQSIVTEYEKHCGWSGSAAPNSGLSETGVHILEEIIAFMRKFVILTESELLVIALWIAHTWVFEASEATPYLAVTSAEMRSGKTRLLEILELLVRNPWRTGRITPAVLARKIEADCPTLLLDEWDAMAGAHHESTESVRGILNSGHRRNGKVSVCGPKSKGFEPINFRVFCPKMIAGIGKLPDTICDRSIPIRLKRKAPHEKVDRFRLRLFSPVAKNLRERLRAWVQSHYQILKDAKPGLPEALSDRQQDGAEPLLAIADAAGSEWPSRARTAIIELHGRDGATNESIGVSLISDIRDIFSEKHAQMLSSLQLVGTLSKMEGRPWPAMEHSGVITPNSLARLLAPFEIFPRNLRVGASIVKGYRFDSFTEAWNRYLPGVSHPSSGPANATPLQPAKTLINAQHLKKAPESDVAPSESRLCLQMESVVAP